MTNSLQSLGEEYLQNAFAQEEKIADCKKRLRDAGKKKNIDEIYRLRKLLKLFYVQKYELLENGNRLINYYTNEKGGIN